MTVSERLQSCWGPSRLAYHGHLRSSQWSKPQKLRLPPLEWKIRACSDILPDALRGRPHQSLQPSFTALSPWAIFMFQCRSFIKHSLWSVCFLLVMWKTGMFLWATIRPNFAEYWLYFQILYYRLKNFRQKCSIGPAEPFKFVNYCRMWTLMV